MADAARLRKMVGKVTSLNTDLGLFEDGTADVTWDQEEWFQLRSGGRNVGSAYITERGLLHDGQPCQAACCLAGATVLEFAPAGTVVLGTLVRLPDGRQAATSELAMELLGLKSQWSDCGNLFRGNNTAGDLRRIAESLIAEQGE
jgi:hypothetical protein